MGNAGAGKSTLAKKLVELESAAHLSLDGIAFEHGSERRPLEDSIADAKKFIDANGSWVIEGCYADILESILEYCEELIFLNPGVETCVEHCRARQWEPEKFESSQEQGKNLDNLIEWVRMYETRDDEYGLISHRALYESFDGRKGELSDPNEYTAVQKCVAANPHSAS